MIEEIQQFISKSLITTSLAILALSVVGLFLDGTMICISTNFEILAFSIIVEGIKKVFERIELHNFVIEILIKNILITVVGIGFGYTFHWLDKLPIWILVGMIVIILFVIFLLEVNKTKSDILEINRSISRKRIHSGLC